MEPFKYLALRLIATSQSFVEDKSFADGQLTRKTLKITSYSTSSICLCLIDHLTVSFCSLNPLALFINRRRSVTLCQTQVKLLAYNIYATAYIYCTACLSPLHTIKHNSTCLIGSHKTLLVHFTAYTAVRHSLGHYNLLIIFTQK